LTKNKISKFSTGWKTSSNCHSLINLAVASKANYQSVHVSCVHTKINMNKRGKTVKIMKSSHADILKTDSMEKFQKLLREIAEIEEKLTCDSKAINNNLMLLEQSTKRSANFS
jgi:hypothetical protein